MPGYPRARQDYTASAFNPSSSSRNAFQPFREPTPHLTTNPATASSRPKRLSTDHQPSPVTPAVTGIAYPTEEDEDEDENDEPVHTTSNAADHAPSQRYPITIDQNHYYRDGSRNSRSNHSPPANRHSNHPMHVYQLNGHSNGNMAGSSQDDSSDNAAGFAATGGSTLDHIWDTIREKNARKMAKERPKVESLEEITGELAHSDYPLHPNRQPQGGGHSHSYQQPSAAQTLDNIETMSFPMPIAQDYIQQAQESSKQVKKRKSLVSFRESKDGRSMNATIELPPEVKKQDIHISFNARRLVVSWMVIDITEWEEDDGRIIRERVEQIFQRTLPLGEGTKYEEIKSYMIKNRLIIRYPNMRCIRVEPKHSDDT